MKRGFIIGIVWIAVITCIISFGATVYFLDNNSNRNEIEKFEEGLVDSQKSKEVYQTNQSSVRTNTLVNLGNKENKSEKKNKKSEDLERVADEIVDWEDSLDSITSKASSFIKPVKGEVLKELSTENLVYSNTLKEWNIHYGTDYKAKLGDEVYSIRDGKIKEINFNYEYGDYIVIEHDDGYESLCANITVLDALEEGTLLQQGQLIGFVAESFGFEAADETHLHFELKKDGKYFSI